MEELHAGPVTAPSTENVSLKLQLGLSGPDSSGDLWMRGRAFFRAGFRWGRAARGGGGIFSFTPFRTKSLVCALDPDALLASPLSLYTFSLSQKQALCILKSQGLVLNVPTSERKHIAFHVVLHRDESLTSL